jgi:DNA-binding beta-propeller fold protein YncE
MRARRLAVAFAVSVLAEAAALHAAGAAEPQPPLVLEATIPLDHVAGRIDHLAIDLGRRRLIVAELGNGSVDVIDLATAKVAHRIAGLKAPQGVAATADIIAAANADDGTVRLFHAGDFSAAKTIALGDDADNVRIDPRGPRIIVGYGAGGLAIIEPTTGAKLAEVPLAAHPEGFQLDPITGRIYVNVPNARQIAVIDLALGKQVASWTPPDLRENFPLAIEESGVTVASVFRRPARLVLIEAASGAIKANVGTCGDADDVFFDTPRHRIYVSCGEGVVDVFQQDAEGPRRIARIPTSSGARTALFVPELDRLFVAARAGLLVSAASILVLRPQP